MNETCLVDLPDVAGRIGRTHAKAGNKTSVQVPVPHPASLRTSDYGLQRQDYEKDNQKESF